MSKLLTLDDFEVEGRTVLVRPDFNVPLDPETKEIIDDTRIREHATTIEELACKGAKVVILAHQGRPGEPDYLESMEKHARRLSEILGRPVNYVDDLFGSEACNAISKLKAGEILLLKNVRSYPGETSRLTAEEHARSELVSKLSRLVDLFVLDGFSVAHRSHASVVGFTVALPSCMGRVMEREVKALEKAIEKPEKPFICVLGGAKPEKATSIVEYLLSRGLADLILTGGLVGQLFLTAKEVDLGSKSLQFLEKRGFLKLKPEARRLLERYGDKIETPVDVAVDEDGVRREVRVEELPVESPIADIGSETVKAYRKVISQAKTILVSGPLGVYEREQFAKGTEEVYRAVAESGAYAVGGGGDTSAAIERFRLKEEFSYVSLAGGAFIEYISGGKLPGIEALRAAAARWRS